MPSPGSEQEEQLNWTAGAATGAPFRVTVAAGMKCSAWPVLLVTSITNEFWVPTSTLFERLEKLMKPPVSLTAARLSSEPLELARAAPPKPATPSRITNDESIGIGLFDIARISPP